MLEHRVCRIKVERRSLERCAIFVFWCFVSRYAVRACWPVELMVARVRQLVDQAEADRAELATQAEEYEDRLTEKVALLDEAREEALQQKKTYEEMQVQIEEDADREIVDIKTKYEYKLKAERNSNVRLRGETGVMKKRFVRWVRGWTAGYTQIIPRLSMHKVSKCGKI